MSGKLTALFDDSLNNKRGLSPTTPQSLDDISTKPELQNYSIEILKNFQEVSPKVDYSDFSNFVFFNSALDYFNITGEKILNEYPYDQSIDQVQSFLNDLDDYQRYVVSMWPSNTGHIRFNPAISSSYISILDAGNDSGVSKTGLLSPNTSSLSLELWCVPPPALTGSTDSMVLVQRVSGSGDGYSIFFSGSQAFFEIASASVSAQLSVPVIPGQVSYYSFVFDRTISPSTVTVFTGSSDSFPIPVSSATVDIAGPIYLGNGTMYVGSGTVSGKVIRPLTGSLDELRIWGLPLSAADISSSFNVRAYAQRNLLGAWSFNESGSVPGGSSIQENTVVLDRSGHKLNGIISGYHWLVRGSGSLLPFDSPDLILSINSPEVQAFIAEQQISGTLYDDLNDNHIINLLPDSFFELEQERGTQVLQNFLYILARQFDYLKVRIDQFVKVLRTNYGDFDQTPDALLAEVGRFFGWEFTGNFLNADVFQYVIGKDVLPNLDKNRELEVKLYEIKNEFWRRTLNNLAYLYKTKGTKESIESLLRAYGVDGTFIRLKEYGLKADSRISTTRANAQKSVPVIAFGTGSGSGSYVLAPVLTSSLSAVESRICFPTSVTADMTASLTTGTIWYAVDATGSLYNFYYTRDTSDVTGSLHFSCSDSVVDLNSVPIFDGNFWNVVVQRDYLSGSAEISVRLLDSDSITVVLTSSAANTISTSSIAFVSFSLGANPNSLTGSEMWTQEFRIWSRNLDSGELDDHTLNFQSYGTNDASITTALDLHWRLDQEMQANSQGTLTGSAIDLSGKLRDGTGKNFENGIYPFKRFLLDYNNITSPDSGWSDDKVRVIYSSIIGAGEQVIDDNTVALELNMVEALNEDISQIISSLQVFNNLIGIPANRFREEYSDLSSVRTQYFKRLQGRLNFRVFADMLEFFDRSFITVIRRLLPERVNFIGDEFVVESHMLERPKYQWPYRRRDLDLDLEGVITVFIRT